MPRLLLRDTRRSYIQTLDSLEELEKEITACLKGNRGNSSVVSTMLNTLLAWPDHPYGFGTLYGSEFNQETKSREIFVVATPWT